MSIRLMSQVWEDARIQSQAELLVLLALADHARDDGLCWPSIRTIAAKARIEERSAQRILRRLIEKGLVELVSQGGCIEGHNVPNHYRVKGGDAGSPHGLTESHPGATLGRGVGGDRQSPRGDSENRDGVTLGQGNHHIEPSLSKTTTTTCSELDNQHRDEASEASSSSRRFFGGEVSSETERDRTRRAETAIPSALIDQLGREYGLSEKQRKVVSEYRDSRGEEFVREKAEIVRAQPRQNAARALMAALRDDWQPPLTKISLLWGRPFDHDVVLERFPGSQTPRVEKDGLTLITRVSSPALNGCWTPRAIRRDSAEAAAFKLRRSATASEEKTSNHLQARS